jgi:predicted DNA-binding protein
MGNDYREQSERMRGFQLRLPNRLYADLEQLAIRDGRSVANLLRFIAQRYVDEQNREKFCGGKDE